MNRIHKRQLPLSLSLYLHVLLQLPSPQKQQRNKQITFSPEHIFAPKFTPRYTPISRTMSPTHAQPFFRVVPTLMSVAMSMQAAQCHLRVRAFAFPPFPSREFPPSHSCVTFPTLSKEVFSFSFFLSHAHTHIHARNDFRGVGSPGWFVGEQSGKVSSVMVDEPLEARRWDLYRCWCTRAGSGSSATPDKRIAWMESSVSAESRIY